MWPLRFPGKMYICNLDELGSKGGAIGGEKVECFMRICVLSSLELDQRLKLCYLRRSAMDLGTRVEN